MDAMTQPSDGVRALDRLVGTWSVTGDKLTIWAGAKGSPAYFEGAFSADGNTMSGDWVYLGGGGYSATMTRR